MAIFIIALVFLVAWGIYAITLFRRARKQPETLNTFQFQSIPGVFTTLGVLGTFLGIAVALWEFDVKDIGGSIDQLLIGMKTAFLSSIFGIIASLYSGYHVKNYLHLYGDQFPVPESEETSALNAVKDAINETKAEIQVMRKAFVDTNTQSAQDLLGGIKDTNEKLLAMTERAGKDNKEMVRTLNRNHELMEEKFTEFAELLAQANTEALREAMENLIRDFSGTFQTLIEGLVNQNFEQLNNSIAALNIWQEQHRAEVDRLHTQLQEIITRLGRVSTQLDGTYTSMETSMGKTAGSLERISEKSKQLVDDEGRLAKIVLALEQVMVEENKLTQAFDKAVLAMGELQAGTAEFETTKRQITDWLNREKGIHSAMTLFNAGITELTQRLGELEAIKMEDLRLLDNNFDKRLGSALNTSFGHLDRLIKEYVTFMEKNRKIEIQVKEKSNA